MFSEDELIPISALQHYVFCPRQCALIHIEQVWRENELTAKGRVFHERAHASATESRGDLVVSRGVRLRSLEYGLIGQADILEFHRTSGDGIILAGRKGQWRPALVEYKRGRPKGGSCDEVQLCGQALCLEEMFKLQISSGALFYGEPRRREDVEFTVALRQLTASTIRAVRDLLHAGILPTGTYDPKCKSCSLIDECQPRLAEGKRSGAEYLQQRIRDALRDT
jgi:CRISPR-associated exonuclease Cas4